MPPKKTVTTVDLGEMLGELKAMFIQQYPAANSIIPRGPFCKL
jgi:hypothetical protein